MRIFVLAMVALFVAVSPALTADATYVENQTLLDAFGKKGGPLAKGELYNIGTNRRTGNGTVEIHEKETDIFFVVDGSATLIVGGTPVDVEQRRPFQKGAKDITGGQSYSLKKGDVVVIPAGVPHWFKQVNGFINYVTVKSITP